MWNFNTTSETVQLLLKWWVGTQHRSLNCTILRKSFHKSTQKLHSKYLRKNNSAISLCFVNVIGISSVLEPVCNAALPFYETWHVCLFHHVCFEALCSCANRWWQHSKTSSFHVIIFQNSPLERWKCIHRDRRWLDDVSHVEDVAQSALDALIIWWKGARPP